MTSNSHSSESRVLHLQVETLYKHLTSVLVTNYFNALLVVFVMWHSGISHTYLLLWLAAIYLITLFRTVVAWKFRQDELREQRALSWQRLFTLSAYVSGITWGMAGYVFYIPNGGIYEAFIIVFVLGLGAGSLAFMASHRVTFIGFLSLLMLPLLVRITQVNDMPHMVMSAMLLMYWVVFLVFSRNINQAILEGMMLRFDNLDLVVKLTEEKDVAEKANIAKSKFLAAASHDLRQPLHALSLLAGALAERIQYQEVKDIVDKIRAAVAALENLFNALLDISKLDSGVLQPCIEDFYLKVLFERIENDHRPEAEKKGLTFKVGDCGNVVLQSDSILLERILRNFVSNAIRYTQNGKVTLECKKMGDTLLIEVSDTGVGIPDDAQQTIFDEYVQLDNPERNRNKGLGLGLAIVWRIARLLGHTVTLQSEKGKGSCFSVSVPLREGVEVPEPQPFVMPEFSKDLNELNVLVIDDEVSILEALKVLLGGWGCEVILSESVEHARQALHTLEVIPDAIISDYRLRDGINGVETIKAIEAMVGHEVPAVLITGDLEVDAGSGISESYRVLHKPVQPARLRAFLKYVQSQKSESEKLGARKEELGTRN